MSSFYKKYFIGYEENKIPKANGKGTQIDRKYVGVYYRQDITNAGRIIVRILYAALVSAAILLFIHTSSRPSDFNAAFYVTISQGLTVLTLIWVIWILIPYITTPRNMKIYNYQSTSPKLMKASIFSLTAFCLDAIMVLLCILLQDKSADLLIYPAEYILCGINMLIINQIEKRIPYKRIPNSEMGMR